MSWANTIQVGPGQHGVTNPKRYLARKHRFQTTRVPRGRWDLADYHVLQDINNASETIRTALEADQQHDHNIAEILKHPIEIILQYATEKGLTQVDLLWLLMIWMGQRVKITNEEYFPWEWLKWNWMMKEPYKELLAQYSNQYQKEIEGLFANEKVKDEIR